MIKNDKIFYVYQDDMAVSERNLLFATKNHEVTEFNIPPWEYLEKLMPPITEEQKLVIYLFTFLLS